MLDNRGSRRQKELGSEGGKVQNNGGTLGPAMVANGGITEWECIGEKAFPAENSLIVTDFIYI